MRVMVRDLDQGDAGTMRAGEMVRDLIEPALTRGEEVTLDFVGVRYCNAAFLNAAVGRLIESDVQERLPALLRYENMKPLWKGALESVIGWAERRRKYPAGAAAVDDYWLEYFAEEM